MSPAEYAHKGSHTTTNTHPSIFHPVCWDLQRMKDTQKQRQSDPSISSTLPCPFKVKCLLPSLKTNTKIKPMLLASVAALLPFNSE